MKKLMFKYLSLLLFVSLIACSGKQETAAEETTAEADSDEWAMMDEFHMIMAESFHPYKDSANLAPAIANAEEMAALAAKWSSSELPAKVNTESVIADLAALSTATTAFVQTAQSGDQTLIAASLTELHDLFHNLQNAWYGGGGMHGNDHDHQH
jgi:hypothetical protein